MVLGEFACTGQGYVFVYLFLSLVRSVRFLRSSGFLEDKLPTQEANPSLVVFVVFFGGGETTGKPLKG